MKRGENFGLYALVSLAAKVTVDVYTTEKEVYTLPGGKGVQVSSVATVVPGPVHREIFAEPSQLIVVIV